MKILMYLALALYAGTLMATSVLAQKYSQQEKQSQISQLASGELTRTGIRILPNR